MRLLYPFYALVAFFCVAAMTASAAEPLAKHVFVISFDQATPAGIEKADMPTFKRMAVTGAHTWHAYTIVPSLTLPAHASMLTGVGIQKHQIDWNEYEPERGKVKVPTIFSAAKEHGLSTAMYVSKPKFQHLNLPGSVDRFYVDEARNDAETTAAVFAKEIALKRPNLCFIHFGDPDVASHAHGVNSPEKMAAYAATDRALKIIGRAVASAGLVSNSVFILTTDHGGHDYTDDEGNIRGAHGSSSPEDVEIPWVAWGTHVKKGFEITRPVLQVDTAATALWLLGVPLPEGMWGHPVTSAFSP